MKESYKNGTSWYRVYSDGWIEQGGRATSPTGSGVAYNLLKNFTNTNYCIIGVDVGNTNSNIEVAFGSLTVSSFKIFNNGKHNISWRACGY